MAYFKNTITKDYIQKGSVYFNNTKTIKIIFKKPFNIIPTVMISLGDQSNTVPYKQEETKTYFYIKFKTAYTGWVSFTAIEGDLNDTN